MVDREEEELDSEMDNEEPEEAEADPGPDTLEPMLDLMEEIESHRTRLKLVVQQGVSDPNVPMVELVDTAMSLIQDIANRVYDNLYEIRRYLVETVEPVLLGGGAEGEGADAGGIAFGESDAARLARVLTWMKTALSTGERPTDETAKAQVLALEADVDALLGRMTAEAQAQRAEAQ
jgi:hypothetical protein